MPPLQQVAVVRSAVELYAAQGFTTVQNGLATLEQIKGMSGASKVGLIPQRLVLWPKDELGLEVAEGTLDLGPYASGRVHIGAAKFVGDGSIQGYTGFLSEPYYQPGEHAAEYRGYPNIDAATLKTQVKAIHCSGQQVAVHGNGDAAIDQFLDAWEAALEACPADDARPVLVHAQMSRARSTRTNEETRRDSELLQCACLLLGRPAPRPLPRPRARRSNQPCGERPGPRAFPLRPTSTHRSCRSIRCCNSGLRSPVRHRAVRPWAPRNASPWNRPCAR